MESKPSRLIEEKELNDPYLCASFYLSGEKAKTFAQICANTFSLFSQSEEEMLFGMEAQWKWVNESELIQLFLFNIPDEPRPLERAKIALVQLIQARTGQNMLQDWTFFRQRLLEIIKKADIFLPIDAPQQLRINQSDQFWGYSLVYGADYIAELPLMNEIFYQLKPNLQQTVKSFVDNPVQVIKQVTFGVTKIINNKDFGFISLIDVPTGLGKDAGLVYWLLMRKNDAAFNNWCFSPNSRLSQIEIFAHKAFAHAFQLQLFRSEWDETIERLLWDNAFVYETSETENQQLALNTLSNNVSKLIKIHPLAEAVNATLQQQLVNITITRSQLYDNQIFQHLTKLMQNNADDVRLFTEKLKAISSSTNTSIDFYRVKLTQADELSNKRLQSIITFLGLLLGVLQVYSNTDASNLIKWLCSSQQPTTYSQELLVRVATAITIALLMPPIFRSLLDAFRRDTY
ncbi:hypothetical protein [Spirosoma foliorum]|uniref:Uncharacterized protein n=1 Tax=Spirosoma foliorum TaxID=2710596 RepID=A0A7G5GRL8_9BACT|nr:hypothetical protein [Spirosoma foliorum]QMW01510.1 hypothetical protein H3H32_26640 [Spirosoma foliorum]